jgi:hypothetical protein
MDREGVIRSRRETPNTRQNENKQRRAFLFSHHSLLLLFSFFCCSFCCRFLFIFNCFVCFALSNTCDAIQTHSSQRVRCLSVLDVSTPCFSLLPSLTNTTFEFSYLFQFKQFNYYYI